MPVPEAYPPPGHLLDRLGLSLGVDDRGRAVALLPLSEEPPVTSEARALAAAAVVTGLDVVALRCLAASNVGPAVTANLGVSLGFDQLVGAVALRAEVVRCGRTLAVVAVDLGRLGHAEVTAALLGPQGPTPAPARTPQGPPQPPARVEPLSPATFGLVAQATGGWRLEPSPTVINRVGKVHGGAQAALALLSGLAEHPAAPGSAVVDLEVAYLRAAEGPMHPRIGPRGPGGCSMTLVDQPSATVAAWALVGLAGALAA